jgi:taurine dioxygenase
MSAVYEGLSGRMQSFLSGLEAVHDFKPFRSLFPDTREGIDRLRKYEDLYPPSTHPIVRVHPITGKKVLFVNPQFTLYIKGMEEDESRTILDLLFRKTYIHEYQYRHKWQPDMVLFWDNRCVQHSALHDYYPKRRLMERVTIKGDKPVGDAPPADPSEIRRYLSPPVMAFESRQKRQHEL